MNGKLKWVIAFSIGVFSLASAKNDSLKLRAKLNLLPRYSILKTGLAFSASPPLAAAYFALNSAAAAALGLSPPFFASFFS